MRVRPALSLAPRADLAQRLAPRLDLTRTRTRARTWPTALLHALKLLPHSAASAVHGGSSPAWCIATIVAATWGVGLGLGLGVGLGLALGFVLG